MEKQQMQEVINAILSGVVQTSVWENIMATDPAIQQVSNEYLNILDQIKEKCGFEMANEFDEAHESVVAAYIDAAMIYGMRTMMALQYGVNRPIEYSQFFHNQTTCAKGDVA